MATQRASTIEYRTRLFHEACSVIDGAYSSDLRIDDAARELASSRRQLQRAFAEVGDTTFREYLIGVRMRRSAELLAAADHTPIRAIARAVGYSQPAQFAKAFQRHYGMTPSSFRRHGGWPPAGPSTPEARQ